MNNKATPSHEPGTISGTEREGHAAARVKRFLPAVSVILFLVALWSLDRLLHDYHWHDIRQALGDIPLERALLAVALTVLSYVALTGYDLLALWHIGRKIPYRRTVFVSTIAFALSNSITPSFLSGGAVRFRSYTAWGLDAVEVAKVIVFCTLMGGLGVSLLGGVGLAFFPSVLDNNPYVIPALVRPLGWLLLCIPLGYLCLSIVGYVRGGRGRVFRHIPNPFVALSQIGVAFLDYAFSGAVLYALLPEHALSFGEFAGVYAVAIAIGVASHVPGGLGVFETVILGMLTHRIPGDTAVGALLAYRGIYYLAPLLTGMVALATMELLTRKQDAFKAASGIVRAVSPLAPGFFAFCTLVAGSILLFSSAAPAVESRIRILETLLPLPVMEMSHFLSSIVGLLLIILARGLQRRVDAARWICAALLMAGVVLSLLKGLDYEEAILLSVVLVGLLFAKGEFYRHASLFAPHISVAWASAVAVTLACTVWLGMFAYKHVEYGHELWWQFSHSGDASRFLRSSVGTATVLLLTSVTWLFSPRRVKPELPSAADLQTVEQIVKTTSASSVNLVFLGDKALLFNPSKTAFAMYGIEGRSWIAMNGPFGDPAGVLDIIWSFKELADRHGGYAAFYQVRAEDVHDYVDAGFKVLKLGEEGRADLASFTLAGSAMKDQRHTLTKLAKEGSSFRVVPVEEVPAMLPTLKSISDEWLARKNAKEKGFSLGFFDEAYVLRYPQAVIERDGRIVAFANLWQSFDKQELSVDLMRFSEDAPKGVMDFLFTNIMLWGKEEGFHWFMLGMAPLSGLEMKPNAPLWNRLGGLMFRHGEHFYNFEGLRQYKEKWNPEWEPRYLAYDARGSAPEILTNVATLISGSFLGLFKK